MNSLASIVQKNLLFKMVFGFGFLVFGNFTVLIFNFLRMNLCKRLILRIWIFIRFRKVLQIRFGKLFWLESFGTGYDWQTAYPFNGQHRREYRRRQRTREQSGLQTLSIYGSRFTLRNKTLASLCIQKKFIIGWTNWIFNATNRRTNAEIKRLHGQNRNIQKNWKR